MATASVDGALTEIRRRIAKLGEETVPLQEAAGRVLARDLVAGMSQPPFAASAMDGYAVRFDEAKIGVSLKVAGVSSAGGRFHNAVGGGEAVRIFTGAPVPICADHVVVQEDVTRDGDFIVVNRAQPRRSNIRPKGCDFLGRALLLGAGERLTGPKLALAAAANVASVGVVRRPRVALIANGDELAMPGEILSPDQIVCSIPFALLPMIESWGGAAEFLGIAADDEASIGELARQGLDYDLIVPIGGASVGDRDHMRAAFSAFDFHPSFDKVDMKPGKPTWFGFAGTAPVIGLPGNPASAIVTAALFVRAAIERMLGAPPTQEQAIRLAAALPANGAREHFVRGRIINANAAERAVEPFADQDSSLLSVMAAADVLIRRPANAPPAALGRLVECFPV